MLRVGETFSCYSEWGKEVCRDAGPGAAGGCVFPCFIRRGGGGGGAGGLACREPGSGLDYGLVKATCGTTDSFK